MTQLHLRDVRNYAALEFAPERGLNVLVGANAQGKSNLLEAIALLGTGKSFRTTHEAEIIRNGSAGATLWGEGRLAAGTVRLACTLTSSAAGFRKVYALNGRSVRYAGYLGRLRVVTFVPAHLRLVTGPPALRRSLLNATLAQESSSYYAALAAYEKALAQKNALLRAAEPPDADLLATYNAQLVATGAPIVGARAALIAALDRRAKAIYRTWVGTGEGDLELSYRPSVAYDAAGGEAIAAAFGARLALQASAEVARRQALVGPHRDDVEFRLGGELLDVFGSQGQQRTAVLALKVAEYEELEARSGEAPILLLDDVLSELDAERKRAFLQGVASVEQAFITATSEVGVAVAATYRVRNANLQRVAA